MEMLSVWYAAIESVSPEFESTVSVLTSAGSAVPLSPPAKPVDELEPRLGDEEHDQQP